jgi:hypothetical protein
MSCPELTFVVLDKKTKKPVLDKKGSRSGTGARSTVCGAFRSM